MEQLPKEQYGVPPGVVDYIDIHLQGHSGGRYCLPCHIQRERIDAFASYFHHLTLCHRRSPTWSRSSELMWRSAPNLLPLERASILPLI
jgi:hypothetical protein